MARAMSPSVESSVVLPRSLIVISGHDGICAFAEYMQAIDSNSPNNIEETLRTAILNLHSGNQTSRVESANGKYFHYKFRPSKVN